MVSSLFQIILGFSGLIGLVLQYVGPLAIIPTITLVGLPLYSAAANFSGKTFLCVLYIVIFSIMYAETVNFFLKV